MRLRSYAIAAALCVACGSSGTSSTGVGNPGVISLEIVTDDDDSEPVLAQGGESATDEDGNAAAGGANDGESGDAGAASDDQSLPRGAIHHAVLVLGSLHWLPCNPAIAPTVLVGPFVLDLAQHPVAQIPAVTLPEGGFCGIDAPLAPATAPAALAGRSLFFDGVRADGTLFLLYAEMKATLRLRAAAGVHWDESTPAVLWAFRPRRWLSPGELDQATPTPDDNGVTAIVIDVDRHRLLYRRIQARLAGRSTLYGDLDQNRQLDPEDRSALLGLGSDNAD